MKRFGKMALFHKRFNHQPTCLLQLSFFCHFLQISATIHWVISAAFPTLKSKYLNYIKTAIKAELLGDRWSKCK